MLLGDRKEIRKGERIGKAAMQLLRFAFVGPLKKYRPIHAKDVAGAMVILSHENFTGTRIVESDGLQKIADGSISS
jgi:hypothetical protein